MQTVLSKSLTLAEFLAKPETKPAKEFVDGQIYTKPMPQGKHSRLQLKLCNAINSEVEAQQTALAFPELRCTFGGRSLVPDVSVFAWDRIPFDADGEIANSFSLHPNWTIEILSPDQNTTKVIRNILYCLDHGTAMGWLVDPAERLMIVFSPDQQPIVLIDELQPLPTPDFINLDLRLLQVFGWLKPSTVA